MNKVLASIVILLLSVSCYGQKLKSTFLLVDATYHPDTLWVVSSFWVSGGEVNQKIPLRVIGNNLEGLLRPNLSLGTVSFFIDLNMENSQRLAKGEIGLPSPVDEDETTYFGFEYKIPRKGGTVSVPIIHPDIPALEAKANAFEAEIKLSKDQVLRSQFPAMPWEKALERDQAVYSFQLQVLPAWIKFKLYEQKLPFWSVERIVDGGVLLVLLILTFLGYNYLRKNQ